MIVSWLFGFAVWPGSGCCSLLAWVCCWTGWSIARAAVLLSVCYHSSLVKVLGRLSAMDCQDFDTAAASP